MANVVGAAKREGLAPGNKSYVLSAFYVTPASLEIRRHEDRLDDDLKARRGHADEPALSSSASPYPIPLPRDILVTAFHNCFDKLIE
jgi:hypothetical protein